MLRPTVLAVRAFSRCGGYVSVVLYGWGRRKSVDLYMYVCGRRQGAWAHSPETRQAACPKVQNWRDRDLEILPVGVLGGSVGEVRGSRGGRLRVFNVSGACAVTSLRFPHTRVYRNMLSQRPIHTELRIRAPRILKAHA